MRTDSMSADIIDPDELVSVAMAGGPPLFGKASGYNNPEVNSLLNQAAAAQDRATRQKLYYQADRIYHDEAPYVFLFSLTNVTMTSAKVQGFHSLPTGNPRMEEVWLLP